MKELEPKTAPQQWLWFALLATSVIAAIVMKFPV